MAERRASMLAPFVIGVGVSTLSGMLLMHYRESLERQKEEGKQKERALLAGSIGADDVPVRMPAGLFWGDAVMPAPFWLELTEGLGLGSADEAARAYAQTIEEWVKGKGGELVSWSWKPPSVLSASMGDDGVLFVTMRFPKPWTMTAADAKRLRFVPTLWRGEGVPVLDDTVQKPRIQTTSEALYEYADKLASGVEKAVSIGSLIVVGAGVAVLLSWILAARRRAV